MHRGNVLVKRTKEEFIYFRFNNKDYHIKTYGVQATIVDFTLSRVTQKGIYLHPPVTVHEIVREGKPQEVPKKAHTIAHWSGRNGHIYYIVKTIN